MEQHGRPEQTAPGERLPEMRAEGRGGGRAVGAVIQFVMKILQQDLTFNDRNRKQWDVLTFTLAPAPSPPWSVVCLAFVPRKRPFSSAYPLLDGLVAGAFLSVSLASLLSLYCLLSMVLSPFLLLVYRSACIFFFLIRKSF